MLKHPHGAPRHPGVETIQALRENHSQLQPSAAYSNEDFLSPDPLL